MAVKFFCDRCDKEIEGFNYFSSVTFKVSEDSNNWKVKRLPSLHKQLCNKCALAIHEFISINPTALKNEGSNYDTND